MASANVDLARSIFAAWERGDYSSAEWAHPDIEFVIADGPSPGSWRGRAGLAAGWRDFLSAWEGHTQEAEEYRELDEERVLVLARFSARGKTSGLELAQVHAQAAALFHIRDGKVWRFDAYLDRGRALADVGLTAVHRVRIDDLRHCLAGAFERLELTAEGADGLAWLLLDSELRGHPDHGVAAVEILTNLYRDGKLNARPQIQVLHETDGAILIDGDRGCGPAAPTRAMRWCIERARERKGMACSAIRNWQMFVGGPYVRLAAEEGLVGFACTNFNALVAPPGGRTPVFGTNPLAYGIPAGRHSPVVLDVATTLTAMQKVRVAAEDGREMPESVIFDKEGQPTTDPKELLEGGLMASLGNPLAPHKGFGLALFIDAVSGVLSGSAFASGVAQGAPGNFFWALDVEAFMSRDEFLARIDAQIDEIKQGERLPGVEELLVPGERGNRRHAELTARAVVPVSRASWQILSTTCESLGVPLPDAVEQSRSS
jgi:LDH2 family malate/lactate/ureidoglycolate dehydrogenase/ketosteroid isomerase-like protein